jgi:kinesin motor protein
VGNLTEVGVEDGAKALSILDDGQINRTIGRTNMNEYSSRSHTIYKMIIESKERDGQMTPGKSRIPIRARRGGGAFRQAVLNFVDLAGSERVRQTGSEGVRLKEGGHINKSLLSLASVISKLAEGSGHIPYRDSKLTRILQNSLGGNARTAIICAITPSAQFVDESLSTLKFASRAKSIENKPTINEIVSDEVRLRRYEREIEELRGSLQQRKRRRSLAMNVDAVHLQACIRAIAAEVADMAFIFEHVEVDTRCQMERTMEGVRTFVKGLADQITFLLHERQALERALLETKNDKEKDELIAELRTNNQYLTEQLQSMNDAVVVVKERAEREGEGSKEMAAHSFHEKCHQCPKYRIEITQLNEMINRLEKEYEGWMETADIKRLIDEKDVEIKNRQADVDELLARNVAQQSEWRARYLLMHGCIFVGMKR